MKGYKIEYDVLGHDCWGAPEWGYWSEWDGTVYLSLNTAQKIMEDLRYQKRFSKDRYDFRIIEINIEE